MATQEPRRITVGVFSGLTLAGKSFSRDRIMPQFKGAVLVTLDDVRERLWPGRPDAHITGTEHVFKNEATRFEVKTKLIADRPSALFLEMVMLTRKMHQQPFADMINDTNRYLQIIAEEEAKRDGVPVADKLTRVDFRCVYFYCDLAAVERRIRYRLKKRAETGNLRDTAVLDKAGFYRAACQMEYPNIYIPLPINTSDESPAALARQHQEVLSFFRGEMPISQRELERRAAEATALIESFKPSAG